MHLNASVCIYNYKVLSNVWGSKSGFTRRFDFLVCEYIYLPDLKVLGCSEPQIQSTSPAPVRGTLAQPDHLMGPDHLNLLWEAHWSLIVFYSC